MIIFKTETGLTKTLTKILRGLFSWIEDKLGGDKLSLILKKPREINKN